MVLRCGSRQYNADYEKSKRSVSICRGFITSFLVKIERETNRATGSLLLGTTVPPTSCQVSRLVNSLTRVARGMPTVRRTNGQGPLGGRGGRITVPFTLVALQRMV